MSKFEKHLSDAASCGAEAALARAEADRIRTGLTRTPTPTRETHLQCRRSSRNSGPPLHHEPG